MLYPNSGMHAKYPVFQLNYYIVETIVEKHIYLITGGHIEQPNQKKRVEVPQKAADYISKPQPQQDTDQRERKTSAVYRYHLQLVFYVEPQYAYIGNLQKAVTKHYDINEI